MGLRFVQFIPTFASGLPDDYKVLGDVDRRSYRIMRLTGSGKDQSTSQSPLSQRTLHIEVEITLFWVPDVISGIICQVVNFTRSRTICAISVACSSLPANSLSMMPSHLRPRGCHQKSHKAVIQVITFNIRSICSSNSDKFPYNIVL